MLKALSFLRYLHFCPEFLIMLENGLMIKLGLILKLMALQSGPQINAIYILPSISRCKSNQAMTFGHLIEYKMRNNFLQKP